MTRDPILFLLFLLFPTQRNQKGPNNDHDPERRHKPRDPVSAKRIRELQHRVEQTCRPGLIHGLTGACRDCRATGISYSCPAAAVGHIWHDDGCPAVAGTTAWQPHPID